MNTEAQNDGLTLVDSDFEPIKNAENTTAVTAAFSELAISVLCQNVEEMLTVKCSHLKRAWASHCLLLFEKSHRGQKPLDSLRLILEKHKEELKDLLQVAQDRDSDTANLTRACELHKSFTLQTIWATTASGMYDSLDSKRNDWKLFVQCQQTRSLASMALRDPDIRSSLGLTMDDAEKRLRKIQLDEEKLELLSKIVDWDRVYPGGLNGIQSKLEEIIPKEVPVNLKDDYWKSVRNLILGIKGQNEHLQIKLMRLILAAFSKDLQREFVVDLKVKSQYAIEPIVQIWDFIGNDFWDRKLNLSHTWDEQILLLIMVSAGEVIKETLKFPSLVKKDVAMEGKDFEECRFRRDQWIKVRIALGLCKDTALVEIFNLERHIYKWNEIDQEIKHTAPVQEMKKEQTPPDKSTSGGLWSRFIGKDDGVATRDKSSKPKPDNKGNKEE